MLLAGLPGSGKTTLARELESAGMLRICPDELVWQEHGHYGTDFPRGEYRVRERPVLDRVAGELHGHLANGQDVVLDHGLWTAEERTRWRAVAEQAGAMALLVYLPADLDLLWERIQGRNQQTLSDPNSMYFSQSDLARHAGRFDPPGSDESHLVYNGDPATVLRELSAGRGVGDNTRHPRS